MSNIQTSADLVAFCGLYCGACKAYLKKKCPGCHANVKATWCGIRTCCQGKGIQSCADCTEHSDPRSCKKFNNLISKLFGLLFKSDRAACIAQIKVLGLEGHAQAMATLGKQSIQPRSRS